MPQSTDRKRSKQGSSQKAKCIRLKNGSEVTLCSVVDEMQQSLRSAAPDLETFLPSNADSARDIMMTTGVDGYAQINQNKDNTLLTYTSRLKAFVAAVYILSKTTEFSGADLLKFISRDWLAEFTFPLTFLKIVFRYMYELPFMYGNQRSIREQDKNGNQCQPNLLPTTSIQPLGLSFAHAEGLKSALCWVLGDKKGEIYQEIKNQEGNVIGVKGNALREASMLGLMKNLKNDWIRGGVSKWQARPIKFSTLLKLWDVVEELQELRDYTIGVVKPFYRY
ncbi:hypothetical protein BKA69DRAFT_386772 [Paraphysoderma sedebokerense]|nr:hypothetical protein BKA69DRAFT_386772 [Paraphysoderma sedebokerense]